MAERGQHSGGGTIPREGIGQPRPAQPMQTKRSRSGYRFALMTG
jgi:hypothetical protein